ncbi:Spy/CpxP family protein refolding chaperone [Gaoshiqia sediminis]|uniref:Spy/CpxP family protein refolding chaperone n=1 Tax=Gaoshiqia sediminis TaxID=2986998 RepID=A0AA41Y979_9BACT|nr:Spy/CpxP family protein refolding chaperone [Gaoshiqia sediminis]MCW0483562.1 Spy/CpxP family protein refolding chaperone [Gaoshiqia sediminis]
MKTKMGIGLFILVVMMAVNVQAQNVGSLRCLNQISGLTEQQKSEITKLEQAHQQEMTSLRNERRGTTDLATKDAVREKMLAAQSAHRNEVSALLTPEQQQQFASLTASGKGYGRNQKAGFAQGRCARGKQAGVRSGNRSGRGRW